MLPPIFSWILNLIRYSFKTIADNGQRAGAHRVFVLTRCGNGASHFWFGHLPTGPSQPQLRGPWVATTTTETQRPNRRTHILLQYLIERPRWTSSSSPKWSVFLWSTDGDYLFIYLILASLELALIRVWFTRCHGSPIKTWKRAGIALNSIIFSIWPLLWHYLLCRSTSWWRSRFKFNRNGKSNALWSIVEPRIVAAEAAAPAAAAVAQVTSLSFHKCHSISIFWWDFSRNDCVKLSQWIVCLSIRCTWNLWQ